MIWYFSSWIAGATIRLMQVYAPTNILAGFIRTRRGHMWGMPLAAVLVPTYAFAFSRVADTATATNSGWLYLLALLMFWNTGKFVALGMLSVVLLMRAAAREWAWDRRALSALQFGR
ncbi:sulfate permease [Pengzhenrongella phosphoraccumulans]|uniref:sulfate permease n=1 Tax=Pengzhenrongella phosphoraccumulans TaxID=3114394 RepID=UPI003890AD86